VTCTVVVLTSRVCVSACVHVCVKERESFCNMYCTYIFCVLFVYLGLLFCSYFVVLCYFYCFVCTSVGLLPQGVSPIAVSNNNNNFNMQI
jgi:hypothetical protein